METQERIACRLCLKICDSFKVVKGYMKNVLGTLLPEINLAAIHQEPVTCTYCEVMLAKCFDFKMRCLKAHDNIVPFIRNNAVKVHLVDVYLSKNENCAGVPKNHDICGFCMNPANNCCAISHDGEEGDVMLQNITERCLPELDLSIIKRPVICPPCRNSLEDYFDFVMNCLIVEEKIRKYCETLDINGKGHIQLSSLLQLAVKDITTNVVDGNSVDVIKVEKPYCNEGENDEREHSFFCDDIENANEVVEYKNNFVDMVGMKFNNQDQLAPKNTKACKEESNNSDAIKIEAMFREDNEFKEEDRVEMEDQKFLFNEEIEIKTDDTDLHRLEDGIVTQQEVSTVTHTREKSLAPDLGGDQLKEHIKDTSTNKNVSKMHQCEYCSFQTSYKNSLNTHLLIHMSPSEVTMYKCDSCSFQTKYSKCLKSHLVVHKDPSEVTMYKCDSCSFETKYNYCLKMHLLLHKEPSEITMYKCDYCSFQTKQKCRLKSHLVVHKDPSEVTMYKCDFCPFQTKYNKCLKIHVLMHKDPSEVRIRKCDFCSFKTRYNYCLKMHLLLHKEPSEVTSYKCDKCSFRTKLKSSLRNHMVVHKDPSEVTMYKCESCSFQTKVKDIFKHHLLVHKDPSEVTMYKCDSCSFQTKYNRCLKKHLLLHKNPSEVTMYKCDSCLYETKYKGNYTRHHLTVHKTPS